MVELFGIGEVVLGGLVGLDLWIVRLLFGEDFFVYIGEGFFLSFGVFFLFGGVLYFNLSNCFYYDDFFIKSGVVF